METRERILNAAAKLMRSQGLASATTKAIARAVGLSEPALYRHFASKDELFLHVLRERLPRFIDALQDLPGRVGRGKVEITLERIGRAALAFFAETIPMAGSLFSEPELLARHQATLREKGLGPQLAVPALSAYLRAEQRLGRISKAIDPDAGASMLIGACFHRSFVTRFLGDRPTAAQEHRFARQLVRTLLRHRTG